MDSIIHLSNGSAVRVRHTHTEVNALRDRVSPEHEVEFVTLNHTHADGRLFVRPKDIVAVEEIPNIA